jgi:hypothetical protein
MAETYESMRLSKLTPEQRTFNDLEAKKNADHLKRQQDRAAERQAALKEKSRLHHEQMARGKK